MLKHNDKVKKYFSHLAERHDLNFLTLEDLNPNKFPIEKDKCPDYLKLQSLPISETKNTITIVTANPTQANIERIKEYWDYNGKKKIKISVSSRQDIANAIAQRFEKEFVHDISHTRDDMDYKHSASYTFSLAEKIILSLLVIIMILAAMGNFFETTLWFHLLLSLGTVIIISYKTGLTITTLGFLKRTKEKITLEYNNLPVYTILIPLLREKRETITFLLEAIKRFDYPKHLLDIKLLLEKDDIETSNVMKQFDLDWNYQVVMVPPGFPRSKPRACNYGLKFAFGEILTIYDAEDRPESDQLKRVLQVFYNDLLSTFKRFGDYNTKLACVQASLNFYNYKENLLTRLFTIEYTHWFDFLVPALSYINAAVPLGGTSNHFKTDILRKIGGWDPYIGTEDAEIGVRMYRLDYRVKTTLSTTYEEANTKLSNWFKQRTRWNKGYMQTYLVNMRDPIKMMKQVGPWRFLNFQCFVGGNVFIQLANLPLFIFLVTGFILNKEYFSEYYPHYLYIITFYNFVFSNLLYLTCEFIATYNRRLYSLLPFVPLKFFYWILMSGAGYYAIYELLTRPGYWYKTEHGLSKEGRKTDVSIK